MSVESLISQHDPGYVAASIAIAWYASYVALDLARRVRADDRLVAGFWWACGAIVMGLGVWSMHFVGMLGFRPGFTLVYGYGLTAMSLLAAVAAFAVAFGIASRERLTWPIMLIGSSSMAMAVCAMHYLGMAAIDVAPGIVWHAGYVALSVAIALGASVAVLAVVFWMRRFSGAKARAIQVGIAAVMAIGVGGMHYTAMAAASFEAGTICLTTDGLRGHELAWLIGGGTVLLLTATMVTAAVDARLRSQSYALARSLQSSNAELAQANQELHRMAFADNLTGLPNRSLFEDRLQQALHRTDRDNQGRAERHLRHLAVMFIDLDGFKPINDTYGHGAGDEVLREVAHRLQSVARATDTLARIGGDEFVLLVEDLGSEADAGAAAQRILDHLARPFTWHGHALSLAGSIGVALYPGEIAAEKLLTSADAAMYAVKRAGGANYAIYAAHMRSDVSDQLELQSDLRYALQRGELSLHYQPKVFAVTGVLHGVEALLRWTHPTRGAVPPGVFIPIAERFGMINAIGDWVIEEACRQMAAWAAQGLNQRVAINLSAYQLRQPELPERIGTALARHGIDPARLVCEITESAAMEDTESAEQLLQALGRIGVTVSIDDFGTGYSSLSYLRRLPAKQLKIDRSFVNDIDASADARAIIDAVVRLAHALDLHVVAEGVETEGQRRALEALGCDLLQGYYFARPMPAEQLPGWISERCAAAPGHLPAIGTTAIDTTAIDTHVGQPTPA